MDEATALCLKTLALYTIELFWRRDQISHLDFLAIANYPLILFVIFFDILHLLGASIVLVFVILYLHMLSCLSCGLFYHLEFNLHILYYRLENSQSELVSRVLGEKFRVTKGESSWSNHEPHTELVQLCFYFFLVSLKKIAQH